MNATRIKLLAVLWAALVLAVSTARVASAQGPIASGQTATGTISPAGDSDSWTFSANTGDAIVVRVGEITQSGSFTPRVRLYDPSAALVATSYSAVAGEVTFTAASSGTFTAVVDDVNGGAATATGTYRVTLAKTGSSVVVTGGDEGGPLTNGAVNTGTIDVGDLDVWTVTANAGDALIVRMGEAVPASGLTPWLRIYSPTGASLASSYSATASEVAITAPAAGTYLVVAGDGNVGLGGSGTYRITLAKTGDPVTVSPGDEGGPLTNGAMTTGTIDVGDLDAWTVTAGAGDAIVIRMGEAVPASGLTPWLRIYSPTGASLASSSSATASEVAVTAPAAGTYLVVAGDGNVGLGGSGTYRITLAKTGDPVTVSPGDEGGPLTNGAMTPGTIDVGDLDVWTVTANAGEAIIVRMGEAVPASGLTPWLRIYSPTGASLASSYSATASEVAVTAPAAGTYLVVAGDGNVGLGGSGTYRITLAKTGDPVTVSPGDEGGPLTNGAMTTGTIGVGDLDAWTVTAGAGDAIVIRMGEAVPASGLTPWLRIYSPTGVSLASSSSATASEVAVTAPAAGTYLVVAGDGNVGLGGSGTYRLTLAKTGSPVTVSPGDEGGVPGSPWSTAFMDVGDLDLWTVSASAGAPIIVTMQEVTTGSPLAPWLRLYSPSGALLDNSFGAAWAQVSVTAPVTGTYLVIAADGTTGLGGSGTYRIAPLATAGVPGTADVRTFTLSLAPGMPNPFANRTTLRYQIPSARATTLRVYDLQGRLVRTLVDDPSKPAGEYEASWDGRDAQGAMAHPGVYMARLEAGRHPQVQKVVLSR